jgi:hypothetical protein
MTCGFTPGEIGQMTLNDVRRLHAYWEQHPPSHLLLAPFVGFEPAAKNTAAASFSDFLNAIPQVIP